MNDHCEKSAGSACQLALKEGLSLLCMALWIMVSVCWVDDTGPGLGVRVLGDVTQPDGLAVLRQVDAIFIQALKDGGLYDQIWQAFAVFLPVRYASRQSPT